MDETSLEGRVGGLGLGGARGWQLSCPNTWDDRSAQQILRHASTDLDPMCDAERSTLPGARQIWSC